MGKPGVAPLIQNITIVQAQQKQSAAVITGRRAFAPCPENLLFRAKVPQTVITAKSATARRPAPCALFLSSSPTTRATARTKATASAERRPGALA